MGGVGGGEGVAVTPTDTARAWLADPDCVVLDFETTGWVGLACEVAIVDMAGETLLHTRLWPDAPMDPGAERVHGLTLDALAGEPTWLDVYARLADRIRYKHIIAYGMTFDRGVYQREMARMGGSGPPLLGWRCAMHLYRQWLGQPRAVPLPGGDHSALGDCRAALAVLRKVAGAE